MTVALRKGMTIAEFLAWDEGQPERWEFDGDGPVAMVGGTRAHAAICANLAGALVPRLRGGPSRAYVEGLQIRPAGSVRYPDTFVACGAIVNSATVADDPVVVFEVLSPGTASTDQIIKNREYRATPSILRYIVLAQDQIAANVHQRQGEHWVLTSIVDPEAVLDLPEIGVSIPLAELYEGVIGPG